MRIAVTGTHGSGKSTLIEDFLAAHPDYEGVPEPYWLLAQNGTPFVDGASVGDLEEQLAQSCQLILEQAATNLVFDRCPLDFLAYLDIVSPGEGFECEPDGRLLSRIEKALQSLEVIVFVPLRRPDDIAVAIEVPELRARVDRRLKAMLRQDDLGLLAEGPRVLEVTGSRLERVAQLTAALERG